MTVAEMQTYVSQILTGGSTNSKWDATTAVLPALNTAQFEFIHKSFAYSAGSDNVFDELTELQASTTQNVNTTGFDLDGLDSTPGPFIPGGYIASKGTIDGVTRWISRIPMRNLTQRNNRYTKGNDERPLCYIFTNTYYLLVDTGTYPVSVTIYYIREPKELVASGASGYQATTCELNSIHHRLICKMAAAECHRTANNMDKYSSLMQEAENEIKMIATGNAFEPRAKSVESWRNK